MSPRPTIPDRRAVVLAAAERLILEVGFDAMTMAELARRAGIGKGTLYLEFASKDALLDALLRAATERTLAAAGFAEPGHHLPSLSEGYRTAARALLDEPLLCAAFLDDGGVLGRQVARVSDDRYRARHRVVQLWLRQLQADGRLRGDLDPDSVALALSSATLGLLSAARTLGPLTGDELLGALDALATMTRSLEVDAGRP